MFQQIIHYAGGGQRLMCEIQSENDDNCTVIRNISTRVSGFERERDGERETERERLCSFNPGSTSSSMFLSSFTAISGARPTLSLSVLSESCY